MNNKHIEYLTVSLLQALDTNYDVVNMDMVLSVIAALEDTTITKEQLEATRLAKYINLFRRRTKSEQLARRAKSLLKKWREMVGMQQQQSISGGDTTAGALPRSEMLVNFQQNRSQPTSPCSINLIDSGPTRGIDGFGGPHFHNNMVHRSSSSNPTPTSLHTRSANVTSVHSDKRPEIPGGANLYAATSTATMLSSTVGSQPTSFANLLKELCPPSGDSAAPPPVPGISSKGPAARRKAHNHKRGGDALASAETLTLEQTSNSSSAISYTPVPTPTKLGSLEEPIIIDIEDSNSGSDLPDTGKDLNSASSSAAVDVADSSFATSKPAKHRKLKKEKNRGRDRGHPSNALTPLVVIDAESSQSQQPCKMENNKAPLAVAEEKSRCNLMTSNISEILSLSNSSMSSVFPMVDGDGSSALLAKKTNSNTFWPLSNSDLSFAGKFRQQSGLTNDGPTISSAASIAGAGVSDFFPYNENSGAASTSTAKTAPVNTNKFLQFGSGYNSNDSASNSVHSNFEIVDSASQGNKTNLQTRPESVSAFATQRSAGGINNQMFLQQLSSTTVTGPPQLSTSNVEAPASDQKVPKKRGRKKGSKGVDSLLAKEISLSSQMLMQSLSSGGKKVKTTKELYAEMQNRKLGVSTPTTPSKWTASSKQKTSARRDSTCSEPSLHSPRTYDACSTNATVSTVATRSTPEKGSFQRRDAAESESDSSTSGGMSYESGAALPKMSNVGNGLEPNSDSLLPSSKLLAESAVKMRAVKAISEIHRQLRELAQKFPPPPSLSEIERECAADIVPCTCKVVEIPPEHAALGGIKSPHTAANDLLSLGALKSSSSDLPNDDVESEKPVLSISVASSDVVDIKTQSTTEPSPSSDESVAQAEKPIKSIFDLDFDDDEDPLHTIIAEVAAANGNPDIISKTEQETAAEQLLTSANGEDIQLDGLAGSNSNKNQGDVFSTEAFAFYQTPELPIPMAPTYKVEEDSECQAKQRFEVQTQKITNFHINALHNCYIPNVNGNWDNAPIPRSALQDDDDADHPSKLGFNGVDGSSVVPKYGALDGTGERIRKDLSEKSIDKHFKRKKRTPHAERLLDTPFLGVARCLRRERKKLKQRDHDQGEEKSMVEPELIKSESGKVPEPAAPDGEPEQQQQSKERNEVSSTLSADAVEAIIAKPLASSVTVAPNLPTNFHFNDITINVDEAPSIVKTNAVVDGQSLLVIAPNVNFNNNQISQANCLIAEAPDANSAGTDELEMKSMKKRDEESVTVARQTPSPASPKFPEDDACEERSSVYENCGDIKHNNCGGKLDESSNDSHSSLKQTQDSINLRLRRHRRQLLEQEQNSPRSYSKRKRRRKTSTATATAKPPKIRCLKIAVNGGITTRRHIPIANSSEEDAEDQDNDTYSSGSEKDTEAEQDFREFENDCSEEAIEEEEEQTNDDDDSVEDQWQAEYSVHRRDEPHDMDTNECDDEYDETDETADEDDEEIEEEEDYCGDFHEVVTLDISPSTATGNNHIVLTIKKTPSKTNSPSNSLSAMSPVVAPTPVPAKSTPSSQVAAEVAKEEEPQQIAEPVEVKECSNSEVSAPVSSPKGPDVDATTATALKYDAAAYARLLSKYGFHSTFFKRGRRRLKRKSPENPPFRFPDEHPDNATSSTKVFKKLHQQLFFPHELYLKGSRGHKQKILDMSSCSSSCAEESEYEYDSGSSASTIVKVPKVDSAAQDVDAKSAGITQRGCSLSSSSSESESESLDSIESTGMKGNGLDEETAPDKLQRSPEIRDNDELPEENNELLESFNNICLPTKRTIDPEKTSSSTVPPSSSHRIFNIGDISGYDQRITDTGDMERLSQRESTKPKVTGMDALLYLDFEEDNNNEVNCANTKGASSGKNSPKPDVENVNLKTVNAKSPSSSKDNTKLDPSTNTNATPAHIKSTPKFVPLAEYRTGVRAVDEDVNDDEGNDCGRIQQFKEWHQVLQLRSYNEELLTVLPYVVLD